MKTNGLLSILLFLVTSVAAAKTVVLSPDVPLQKQMIQPNVTYVLSSRHDLGGKTLALPANCKLSVTNDGCICNGKVTGTLKNKQVDIRWFGASASDAKYNAEAIENAARVCSQVVIPSETYVLSRSVRLQTQNLTLRGEGTSSQLKVLSPTRVLDVLPQSVGLVVKGISFQGVGSKKEGSYLIYVGNNAARIKVLDCVFDGGTGGVIRLVVNDIEQEALHIVVKGPVLMNCIPSQSFQKICSETKRGWFSFNCSIHCCITFKYFQLQK